MLNAIVAADTWLFRLINGLAGHNRLLDALMKACANDYGIFVCMCGALLALWFGIMDPARRLNIQKGVLAALASLGLSNAAVRISNIFLFRSRPYAVLSNVHLLFYRPTVSSFPSAPAATLFSIAAAVYLADSKVGRWFFLAAVLEGFARVYVGVHYPLDILAGAALGGAVALGVTKLFRSLDPLFNWLLGFIRRLYLA